VQFVLSLGFCEARFDMLCEILLQVVTWVILISRQRHVVPGTARHYYPKDSMGEQVCEQGSTLRELDDFKSMPEPAGDPYTPQGCGSAGRSSASNKIAVIPLFIPRF